MAKTKSLGISAEVQRAIKFLRKYKLPITARNLHNVYCGIHTGIPPCCILHFVVYWDTITSNKEWVGLAQESTIHKILKGNHDSSFFPFAQSIRWTMDNSEGYIRCPSCVVKGKVIRIKYCNCCRSVNRPDYELIIKKLT